MNTLTSLIEKTPLANLDLSTEIAEADYVIAKIDSLDNRLSSITISNQPSENEQILALKAIVSAFTKQ